MNNNTLQLKFRQRLNKLASNDYDNIECWQIVEAFNKAQIEWCRRQLVGTNMRKEGDEQSKRRIDDLQILLTTSTLNGLQRKKFWEGSNFPTNYLEYKRVNTNAYTKCCKDPRSMTVYLVEEANVDLYLRDPLKKPDFEWGETFCTMANNNVRIYTSDDFTIDSPSITYYRKPRNIEIQGCSDPYTNLVSPAMIESEFKDDIVEVIIDNAVAIVAGDINEVTQYTREGQEAEKNN
tara:strand:- start:634 stop:1338 length:705 start_codon:yes stop_codon:yes gene_type:complete